MNKPHPTDPMSRPVHVPQGLAGQIALVSGANSGIGKAVAIGLGKAGADVIVNYVADDRAADAVVAEIEAAGGGAIAIKADVAREAEVRAMFGQVIDRFGTLHILVNNAGLQRDARFDEMTLDQWNFVIGVNLTGQFLCAREAVREFKRRGVDPRVSKAAGKIICMSSVHEVIPWGGHANYAASKGGVMLLMKSMAQELAPFRIRVNSVGPGAIRTPINRQAWSTPEAYAELMKLVPYDRIGEPEDIGNVAVFSRVGHGGLHHGANIYVDGGMTLYPGFETGG